MTAGELIEKLREWPEDRVVLLCGEDGYIDMAPVCEVSATTYTTDPPESVFQCAILLE